MARNVATVDSSCVACGSCIKVCPLKGITVPKGICAKPPKACVGCGKCAVICPAGVITIQLKEEQKIETDVV